MPLENIDMLIKVIEAYDNLGIVSTIDRQQGLVIIRGTEGTYPELVEILRHLPFPLLLENKDMVRYYECKYLFGG